MGSRKPKQEKGKSGRKLTLSKETLKDLNAKGEELVGGKSPTSVHQTCSCAHFAGC